ncbi:MAG: hypothetical protein ACRELS_20290 [Candidatus Rokuibacteriota bacterium]
MYYWGCEEPTDLAALPETARLPLVRGPEMIHVAVIGGDTQWFMGMSAGWGNYGAVLAAPLFQRATRMRIGMAVTIRLLGQKPLVR